MFPIQSAVVATLCRRTPKRHTFFWSAAGSAAPRRFGLPSGEIEDGELEIDAFPHLPSPSPVFVPHPKRRRRCALPAHSKTARRHGGRNTIALRERRNPAGFTATDLRNHPVPGEPGRPNRSHPE